MRWVGQLWYSRRFFVNIWNESVTSYQYLCSMCILSDNCEKWMIMHCVSWKQVFRLKMWEQTAKFFSSSNKTMLWSFFSTNPSISNVQDFFVSFLFILLYIAENSVDFFVASFFGVWLARTKYKDYFCDPQLCFLSFFHCCPKIFE